MPPLLSIVVPTYNEEQVLPLLRRRLTTLVHELLCEVEIILVDDGSTDQTYAMMHAWAVTDPSVKVIALSRNFGHQIAITAGMDASSGDAVVIMDADLVPVLFRGEADFVGSHAARAVVVPEPRRRARPSVDQTLQTFPRRAPAEGLTAGRRWHRRLRAT